MNGSGTAAPLPLTPIFLRQRVLLFGALALVIGLSWAYLVAMSDTAPAAGAAMAHHAAMPMPMRMPDDGSASAALRLSSLLMWAAMAVAMMLPTALPLILLFGRFRQARHPDGGVGAATAQLVLGYLAVWVAFGAAASVLQAWLERAGLASPGMGKLGPVLGGATLVGVGLFQLTPLKAACLARCRSPLMFLMTRWHVGAVGPFLMGAEHGVFCLGCCWALMLVMFVAGVMNLLWMAALTMLMTLEKIAPRGDLLARAAGASAIGAGVWMLYAG